MVYVLTTEQDQAPAQFLPSNGTTPYTVDTTDASLLGGGMAPLTGTNANGTINPSGFGQMTGGAVTLTADTSFPTITVTATVPVQLSPTAPADDLEFNVELQMDDASMPDFIRSMRLLQTDAPGDFCATMTAVWTFQMSDDLPHTFRLKGSTGGTTTARFGTDALPFPTAPGNLLFFGDPAHVVAS